MSASSTPATDPAVELAEAAAAPDAPWNADTPPPAADDGEAGGDGEDAETGSREAARYRRQLRKAEGERDQLSADLEAARRSMVDRVAQTEGRIRPAALWSSGVQLADLLGEDGTVGRGQGGRRLRDPLSTSACPACPGRTAARALPAPRLAPRDSGPPPSPPTGFGGRGRPLDGFSDPDCGRGKKPCTGLTLFEGRGRGGACEATGGPAAVD